MITTMKIAIVTAYDEGYAHCDNKRISLSQPSTTAHPAARTFAHRFPSAQMCFKHVTPLAVPQIHSHLPALHPTSAHEKTLQLICVRTHTHTAHTHIWNCDCNPFYYGACLVADERLLQNSEGGGDELHRGHIPTPLLNGKRPSGLLWNYNQPSLSNATAAFPLALDNCRKRLNTYACISNAPPQPVVEHSSRTSPRILARSVSWID